MNQDSPLTVKDWRYIVQGSFKTKFLSDKIGVSATDIYYAHKTYKGNYYRNMVCLVLEDYLKLKQFSVVDTVGVGDSDFYALRKEDIEIGPNSYKRCITSGFYVVEHVFNGSLKKFVLELAESYYRSDDWDVSIYYAKDNEKFAMKFLSELNDYALDHNYLRGKKIDVGLSHINLDINYTWGDVILPKKVKQDIDSNVVNLFKNIEILKNNDMAIKRGLILKGVPGTGKTLIGKVLCNQIDCSFLWVSPKYLQNSSMVSYICNLAREIAPTILFLEDIDLYGGDRAGSGDPTILGELMNQLDGLVSNQYVITIATTNRVEVLEEALRNRPGRFDRVIDIPKPDYDGRVELLKLYTKKCIVDELDINLVADLTSEFTGAHMKELVTTAALLAVDRGSVKGKQILLTTQFFESSIEEVKNKKVGSMGFGVGDSCNPEDIDD